MTEPIKDKRLIDMLRIRDIFGDDEVAIKDYFKSFVAAITVLLADIETAIHNKDEKTAKMSFHRLRGTSANSGVTPMQQLSMKAENYILVKDWKGVEDTYKEIQEVFQRLKVRLEQENPFATIHNK